MGYSQLDWRPISEYRISVFPETEITETEEVIFF